MHRADQGGSSSDDGQEGTGKSVGRDRRRIWITAALFLLALGLYAPSLRFELLANWDDNRYVTESPFLTGGLGGVREAFTRVYFGGYFPVTHLSYVVDHRIWGLHPAGYHLTNVLLHALNGVLVLFLVLRLTASRIVATFTALLFVIHPVQVESVAWVAERKNVLCMTLFLASMLAHTRARCRMKLPVAGWILFALACLAKPVVVAAPVLFVAYDRWWNGCGLRGLVRRNAAYLVPAVGIAITTLIAHREAGGIKDWAGGSPWTAALLAPRVLRDYAFSIVWPARLDHFYIYDAAAFRSPGGMLAGLALVAGAFWLAWRVEQDRRVIRFGLLWVVVFLLPVSGIVPIAIQRADRYLYFPMVAVGLLTGLVCMRILSAPGFARWRPIGVAVLFVVCGTLAWSTATRLPVWRDSVTLWSDHLIDHPDSATGNINVGAALFARGQLSEARPYYEKVRAIDPRDYRPPLQLARIAEHEGRHEEALELYTLATKVRPAEKRLHDLLGQALVRRKRYDAALDSYRAALEIDPGYVDALVHAGTANLGAGHPDRALAAFEAALRLDPHNAESASGMCVTLGLRNDYERALPWCRRSIAVPEASGLHLGRAAHVQLAAGHVDDAIELAERAIEAAPSMPLGHRVLGDALELRSGR